MAYFDEDGNEVKGLLTEDEAKALIQEQTKSLMESAAKEKIEAETKANTAAAEAEALRKQIADASAAAAGGAGQQSQNDKDQNIAALRKKLEDTESLVSKEREALNARITAIEGDKVQQAINAVAQGDAKLAEKIRYNYDKTLSGVQANTADEIAAKVQNAVKLSTSGPVPNPLDTVLAGGYPQGSGGAKPAGPAKEFTQVETVVGSKLGISDADRAKYGNDPRLTGMNTK